MTTGAIVIDPRRLPVPLRVRKSRHRNWINFGHLWMLHKRQLSRALLVSAIAVGGIALYQTRDVLGFAIAGGADLAQSELAGYGLGIKEISLTGQALTREQEIFTALAIEPRTSTFSFDVDGARERIAKLPSVENVSVRKVYPGKLVVTVVEKVPVARWRVDGVTFVVDAAGEQIGQDYGSYADLPLVIGDGAADNALVMIRALAQYETLSKGLVALSRIGDRRWDMIYDTGLRIQLPEQGVAQALAHLQTYQDKYALLDRDVTVIDLRVADMVAVRPTKKPDEVPKKP